MLTPNRCLPTLTRFAALATLAFSAIAQPAHAYDPIKPNTYNQLNLAAGSASIYEIQVRSANACREDWGSNEQKAACKAKIGAPSRYYAHGGDSSKCKIWKNELSKIKHGTLNDLLENTSDYHVGITLKYIKEKVGANTIWIMPLFPNNDRWSVPDEGMGDCDNTGSPYAVRDYMHASGRLDAFCVKAGVDEYGAEESGDKACWGNGAFEKVITKARAMGMRVMLDVALNHFGHNYLFYDYGSFYPVSKRVEKKQNLDDLWDFAATEDAGLVHPTIMDTVEKMEGFAKSDGRLASALSDIRSKCPKLDGDRLVRAVGMWREMLPWERKQFDCSKPLYLEFAVPGFYLGAKVGSEPQPSKGVGSNFTNNWKDVKFLYHHEYHADWKDGRGDFYNYFVRNREYLFRVMNYWVSRGVDGFRLDHTTDFDSGMGPNEWKYIIGKVNYYDWVRKGRPANHVPPIYMAEEFGDQQGMNHVVDMMTDGYLGDIRGGNGAIKDTAHVERAIDNEYRFGVPGQFSERVFVLRALETHDEHRVYHNTGFNMWTAAGFWGIGAASRGTPMILMGQEFGEHQQLEFRRSALLPARFKGHPNHHDHGKDLAELYRKMNSARLDFANRALLSSNHWYLRSKHTGQADSRIFAQARWDELQGINVVFTFHNLWEVDVEQEYFLPPELGAKLQIQDNLRYRLVNVFDNQQAGACKSGADLKWGLYVKMSAHERLQWLRLELCP